MNTALLIDFGSTYTKITAVDLQKEEIIGTGCGFTTVETSIMEGLNTALACLFARTGQLHFAKILGCSSAAGGLKMIAIGLTPELTAEAARRAALGAGAKVQAVFCHELNEYEVGQIVAFAPDIILLAGGTDGGNKQVILHNAAMIAKMNRDVPIVVAGNKSVTPQVTQILSETMSLVLPTENVMPKLNELNIEPARQTIRDVFLQKIISAKGLDRANQFIHRMVMPTPAAVLKAVELLSIGLNHEIGLGNLMAVDIGGATTDIYSVGKGEPTQTRVILRGLPEPLAKRTVEGDLGMRYSAAALLHAAGVETIADMAEVEQEDVVQFINRIDANKDYLSQTQTEKQVELAMAKMCVALGASRHVGRIETVYTVNGAIPLQTGKDLTAIRAVIGTGGIIVNHPNPQNILQGICFDESTPYILKPQNPEYFIDKQYCLAAMGLLSEDCPEIALRMMKKYITRRV